MVSQSNKGSLTRSSIPVADLHIRSLVRCLATSLAAFADEWLQTPTSIDVIHGAFKYLLGWSTDDKNVVLRDVSWTFTGKRHTNWAFNAN